MGCKKLEFGLNILSISSSIINCVNHTRFYLNNYIYTHDSNSMIGNPIFRFFCSGIFLLLINSRGKMLLISRQNNTVPKVVSSTVQIFYLQETEIVSDPAVYPSATMTSLSPTFTSTSQYTWSAWIYKTAWSDSWETYFRISLDTLYQLGFE